MSVIVQCPKCHASVSVASQQAGQRVQCPRCHQPFLAPSSLSDAGPTTDDDDWLKLDEDGDLSLAPPAEPSQKPAAPPQTSASNSTDELEIDDEFLVPQYGASPSAPVDPEDLFAGLPPVELPDANTAPKTAAANTQATSTQVGDTSAAGSSPARPAAPPAGELGPEERFRVTCPICATMTYAKVKQSGGMIRCNDCHSEFRVPKPPKPKAKVQMSAVENAETFAFSELPSSERQNDPFKKSADELLREAEREPDEEVIRPAYDAPSTIGWFKSVFGIFLDVGVVIHFFGLSALLGLPAALTFAYPVFAIGMVPLALIGIALTVSCGFAILIGVSNEHERIEDWPTVDPTGWFESMLLVIAATAIAVGPPFVFAKLFAAPPVIAIGLVMFCVYAAFPILLLSMLDMQSVTSPFSPDVIKSVTRCQEDWGAFYFSAALLFAALYLYFLNSSYTPAAIGIGVSLSIAVVFLYFAMLGRLALAIGEIVELPALDTDEDDDEEVA